MKSTKSTSKIVLTIGVLSIGFGVYGIISGSPMKDYLSSIFIGVVLFGTAYINNIEWKKKNQQEGKSDQ